MGVRTFRLGVKRSKMLVLATVLGVALSGCGNGDEGDDPAAAADTDGDPAGEPEDSDLPCGTPEMTTVELGFSAHEFHSFPLHYASATGTLEKHGIENLSETYTEGVSSAIQALAGGRLDIQAGTGSSVLSSMTSDTPFIAIGTTLSALTDGFFVGEEYSSIEDIEGQQVAISTFGGESHAAVVLALQEGGLSPDDVEIVQIGGQSDRIAALIGGSVAAAPIDSAIQSQMEEEGLTMVLNLGDTDQVLPRGGLNVTRTWLEENPNTACALVAGTMEAIQLMIEDPASAVEAHMAWSDSDEEDESQAALDSYLAFVEEDLVVDPVAWENMQTVLAETTPAVADLDAHEAYTNDVVQRLDDAGFLEQLGVTIEQ